MLRYLLLFVICSIQGCSGNVTSELKSQVTYHCDRVLEKHEALLNKIRLIPDFKPYLKEIRDFYYAINEDLYYEFKFCLRCRDVDEFLHDRLESDYQLLLSHGEIHHILEDDTLSDNQIEELYRHTCRIVELMKVINEIPVLD